MNGAAQLTHPDSKHAHFGTLPPPFNSFQSCQKHVYGSLCKKSSIFTGKFFFLKHQNGVLQFNLKSRLDLNFTPMSNCRSISFSGIAKKSWKVRASRDLQGNALSPPLAPEKTKRDFPSAPPLKTPHFSYHEKQRGPSGGFRNPTSCFEIQDLPVEYKSPTLSFGLLQARKISAGLG